VRGLQLVCVTVACLLAALADVGAVDVAVLADVGAAVVEQ